MDAWGLVLGFSGETEPTVCVCVGGVAGVYYKELVHIIMEFEKSHHLPSANGRPGKAGGVIEFESQGQRNREPVVQSLV